MIIDSNVHITEDGKWFTSNLNASIDSLLLQMDEAHIDKAVLVPFSGFISNEFIKKISLKYPDRFIPACSINPADFSSKNEAGEAFFNLFQRFDFKIIKFHNRLHKFSPLDERFLEMLSVNNNLPKPKVIFICGLFYARDTPVCELCPPQIVHFYATQFPETNFVMMHSCGSHALPVYEAVRELTNVYLDLSLIVSKYKISSVWLDFKYLVKTFDRRLIWGSDFPEISINQALMDFNELSENIDQSKKNNILSLNLLSIIEN